MDIVLDIGTYLPHYAFDLYLNVILQDENGDGNLKWEGSVKMWAALLTTSHNKSQSIHFTQSYRSYLTKKQDTCWAFS